MKELFALVITGLLAVFYFTMIRPAQQDKNERKTKTHDKQDIDWN